MLLNTFPADDAVSVRELDPLYHAYSVMRQLRRVARWLARENLTEMGSTNLAAQFLRTDGKNTMATLINLSLDPLEAAAYRVRGAKTAKCLKGGQETLLPVKQEDGYGEMTLPALAPFETVTVLIEG